MSAASRHYPFDAFEAFDEFVSLVRLRVLLTQGQEAAEREADGVVAISIGFQRDLPDRQLDQAQFPVLAAGGRDVDLPDCCRRGVEVVVLRTGV